MTIEGDVHGKIGLRADDDSGRHPRDCRAAANVARDDGTSPDKSILSDSYAGENCGISTDTRASFYNGRNDLPIRLRLRRAVRPCSTRILIVGEHHAVANEYV